ncbi:MAG: hypothetical protein EOL87_14155 [Spartobacteria bacterium]|nr:hypothetical protein [Spartobacteria bacterium]
MKSLWNVISALIVAISLEARAADELVMSLDRGGQLTFDALSNATSYRIEWASRPDGVWTSFASAGLALDAIGAEQVSGVHTVQVPMVYRVVACVTPPQYATNTIQSETFSAMSGVQVEGGTVGWFDQGDWLRYDNKNKGQSYI